MPSAGGREGEEGGYGAGKVTVAERPLRVEELAAAAAAGRLREMFATGTAAVILPIQALVRASGEQLVAAEAGSGPLAARLAAALADIQHGRQPHAWSASVAQLAAAAPAAEPFLRHWGGQPFSHERLNSIKL